MNIALRQFQHTVPCAEAHRNAVNRAPAVGPFTAAVKVVLQRSCEDLPFGRDLNEERMQKVRCLLWTFEKRENSPKICEMMKNTNLEFGPVHNHVYVIDLEKCCIKILSIPNSADGACKHICRPSPRARLARLPRDLPRCVVRQCLASSPSTCHPLCTGDSLRPGRTV